jgi:hypothetical protein
MAHTDEMGSDDMPSTAAELSPEALSALMTTGTNRQGAMVQLHPDSPVWEELFLAGMVGVGGGLTQTGSITRQKHADELLDNLLG